MWFLLLFLFLWGDLGNAWLCLAKGHASLLLVFVLMYNSLENASCSQRYLVMNGVRTAMTGHPSIWWHHNVESVFVPKSSCWVWLCSSSMRSLTSAFAMWKVNGCLTRAGYYAWSGKYPWNDFPSSSKWVAVTCFSSLVGLVAVPPKSESSSFPLTHSSSSRKSAQLSFSVHLLHKNVQLFFSLDDIHSTTLHLTTEMTECVRRCQLC